MHCFFITGDTAHSREFSEDAYARAAEPKELYIVPGAGHVDLYDRTGLIPFDKLEDFFRKKPENKKTAYDFFSYNSNLLLEKHF